GVYLDSKDRKLVIFPRERYTRLELNLTIGRYVRGHIADTAGLSAHCGRLYLLRELGDNRVKKHGMASGSREPYRHPPTRTPSTTVYLSVEVWKKDRDSKHIPPCCRPMRDYRQGVSQPVDAHTTQC